MAIYKKPAKYRFATIRQGLFWAVLGLFAGVYCLQPLMKATHREEKAILPKLIDEEEERVKSKTTTLADDDQ